MRSAEASSASEMPEAPAPEIDSLAEVYRRSRSSPLAGAASGKSFLDVGCGDGALAIAFARRGALVTGVDADPGMLALARARSVENAVPLRLVLNRVERIPFSDGQFDIVLASTLLCLVSDRRHAVSEMARMLKRAAGWSSANSALGVCGGSFAAFAECSAPSAGETRISTWRTQAYKRARSGEASTIRPSLAPPD